MLNKASKQIFFFFFSMVKSNCERWQLWGGGGGGGFIIGAWKKHDRGEKGAGEEITEAENIH